jgi:hypothetical protein
VGQGDSGDHKIGRGDLNALPQQRTAQPAKLFSARRIEVENRNVAKKVSNQVQ